MYPLLQERRRTPGPILLDPTSFVWVQRAGAGASLGYFASQLSNWFVAHKDKPPTDLLAAVVLALAVVATWRGDHLRAGGFAMIATVWVEMHYSFIYIGDLNSASLAALPALVAGVAFLGARRTAVVMGFVTAVTAPLASEVGRWLNPASPGIGDPTTVVTLAACLFVIAQMTNLALASREAAIASLSRSERRMAMVFGAIPDGIIAVSRAGLVEAANPAAGALLGTDPAALVGRPSAQVLAAIGNVENGLVTVVNGDVTSQIEVTTTFAAGVGDQPMLVLLHDVTQREAAAKREKRIAEQLRLSQHMETLGQLAGGVAHDMNNMLQATFGVLDELEADLAKRSAGEGRSTVEELRQIWTRGAAVVRQLLAFARQRPDVSGVLEVGASLNGLRSLLTRLVPADIALDLRVDVGDARVAIDPALFEQVVVNLVANARDAVQSGGRIAVTAKVARDDEITNPDPRVVVTVSDNGSGMTEEVRRRLFEPFFTTKEVGKGTGLGLSIAYSAVKQARGEIRVDSEVGKGTTFTLSFPMCETPAPARPAAGATPRARPGETVLVIDDEPLVRRSTARILTGLGYRVLQAEDGVEGVKVAQGQVIDLIVTDVVMPNMGGPEAVTRINEHSPGTRALFVSGYTRDMLGERGAHDVLVKPFRLAELASRVRSAIDQPVVPANPQP